MSKIVKYLIYYSFILILFFSCSDKFDRVIDELNFMRIEFSKCIGCKKCIKDFHCPSNAISFDTKTSTAVIDPKKCTNCKLCRTNFICPENAITNKADNISPGKIKNFAVIDSTTNSLLVSWDRAGDDDSLGIAYKYILKISENAITNENYSNIPVLLDTTFYSENINYEIKNLEQNKTYFFALSAFDEVGNKSELSFLTAKTIELDNTPPAAITNLSFQNVSYNSAVLQWTSVGDDGLIGNASKYEIRYKINQELTANNWETATVYNNSLIPQSPGNMETITLNNLLPNTLYYFAIKVIDNKNNYSPISNIIHFTTDELPDNTPPADINDLNALLFSNNPPIVRLSWTAVGDDGMSGIANHYVIKKSKNIINNANWDLAETIPNSIIPSSPGNIENINISIPYDTLYYFAVRAYDDKGNYSNCSNNASIIINSITTDNIPPAQITDLRVSEIKNKNKKKSNPLIKLMWTATGDDGNIGRASFYIIKKYNQEINETNWSLAENITNTIIPSNAGLTDSLILSINYDTQYYFAIKAVDDNGNISPISNNASILIPTPEDNIPPGKITDLTLINLQAKKNKKSGNLKLIWTAPGDDGYIGQASSYIIKRHTSEITASNWNSAEIIPNSITPNQAGLKDSLIIQINTDTQYYFAIVSVDDNSNLSEISNSPSIIIPSQDTTPPAAITNLSVNYNLAQANNGMKLSWTAPGDDGNSGTAHHYVIKYSLNPINESNWDAATTYPTPPTPQVAGTTQTVTIINLTMGKVYYFAIKAYDENNNASPISNVPTGKLIYKIDQAICNGCNNCFPCPENALIDHGSYVSIDLTKCTQCGLCYQRCPRNAIKKYVVPN